MPSPSSSISLYLPRPRPPIRLVPEDTAYSYNRRAHNCKICNYTTKCKTKKDPCKLLVLSIFWSSLSGWNCFYSSVGRDQIPDRISRGTDVKLGSIISKCDGLYSFRMVGKRIFNKFSCEGIWQRRNNKEECMCCNKEVQCCWATSM